jgi:multidrug transporter EmrE-like cation transporter
MIVGLETCAMSCFKTSLNDWRFFLLGLLLYGGVGILLVQTFKLTGLAFTNALWSGLSIMATTTVGVLYFKEKLHFHDYIAVAMIGAGVLILKFTD